MNLKHVLYGIAVVGATVVPLAGGCALGRKGPIPGSLAASQNGNYVSFDRVGVAGMQYELDSEARRLYNTLLVTQNPSASHLAELLGKADGDRDGKITGSELERALQPNRKDTAPLPQRASHSQHASYTCASAHAPKSAANSDATSGAASASDAAYMSGNRFMLPEGKEHQHQQRHQYTPGDCVLKNTTPALSSENPEKNPPLTIGGVLLGR